MNILVTAFKPFDGNHENMSSLVLDNINYVDKLYLDVLFEEAFVTLQKHLKEKHYDYIVCLGEAPYEKVHFEYVALNVMHARIPDNALKKPQHEKIDASGPLALHTSLPFDDMKKVVTLDFVQDSFHAGTYVCNDLFYRLMHLPIHTPRGFIHVPNQRKYLSQSTSLIQSIVDVLNKRGN